MARGRAHRGNTRISQVQETRDYNRSVGRNAGGNKYLADIMKIQDAAERALRLKREKNIIDYKVD